MAPAFRNRGFLMGKKEVDMNKKTLLTTLLVLFIVSTALAGESATIQVSCTIPSIPGVNAPPRISERVLNINQREEITKKNTTATEGEQIIEKEETKETLLAQGEKVISKVKTVYAR
jgi:hypothetical protein